jgi:cephalosporin hydroxylase
MRMKTLQEIYQNHLQSDKGTFHSYIEVYERIFSSLRLAAKKVLEIGIAGGASLQMFEEYFQGAEVYGVDARIKPTGPFGNCDLTELIETGMHRIRILNAKVKAQVELHFKGVEFDVIIDDASHDLESQLTVYSNFKDKLSANGLYVIEDVYELEQRRASYERMDPEKNVTIYDLRPIKHRVDDVLVVLGQHRQ